MLYSSVNSNFLRKSLTCYFYHFRSVNTAAILYNFVKDELLQSDVPISTIDMCHRTIDQDSSEWILDDFTSTNSTHYPLPLLNSSFWHGDPNYRRPDCYSLVATKNSFKLLARNWTGWKRRGTIHMQCAILMEEVWLKRKPTKKLLTSRKRFLQNLNV
jgi:hypothetical protein